MNAKNKQNLDSLMNLTYAKEIGMSLRLDKCSWIISKSGKGITTEEVEQPEGNIAEVQDS